jgi:CDP-glycerol glycerophosphotransferase (TagB/SpsB family)
LLTEKVKIVEQLSEFCLKHGWNLLVKKHPSEFDNLLDHIFAQKSPNQRFVEHHEMSLFDCIYHSDFVCTQNSTAFIEALFLVKPFSYLTTEGENLWASRSYFSREAASGNFNSIAEYESYLLANEGEEAYKRLQQEFITLQTKYLFKTDGKASRRLLDLAESFVK